MVNKRINQSIKQGLKADVFTRWPSVCCRFESAAESHEVFNDVLLKTGSHEYLSGPDNIEEQKIIEKLYRVCSTARTAFFLMFCSNGVS